MLINATVSATSPGAQSADIIIVRRSVLEVAPEPVLYEISNLVGFDTAGPSGNDYDPRKHDLHYSWNFGESYTYAAPDNVPTANLDSSKSTSPWGAHTYRGNGNFTPTCTITQISDPTKTCVANLTTTTITVGDPDTQFATTDTVFMSPSGDFSVAPAGADTVTASDIDAIMSSGHSIKGQQATPKRLMLNRGEAYTFSGYTHGLNVGQETPSLHIVAGPTGGAVADTNPTVTSTASYGWNDGQSDRDKDFVVQNIDWSTSYDSLTSPTATSNSFFARSQLSPKIYLFDGCSFSGFDSVVADASGSGLCMGVQNDCSVTNHSFWGSKDGGATSPMTGLIFTGCKYASNVNAYVNQSTNGGAQIRITKDVLYQIVEASDFFSRRGWSAFTTNLAIAVQPCLRMGAGDQADAKMYMGRCSFEGGGTVIEVSPAGAGADENSVICNVIVEKNYVVGGYMSGSKGLLNVAHTGATVRNNIFLLPDSVGIEDIGSGQQPAQFMSTNNYGTGDVSGLVNIYSNTCANRRSAAIGNGATLILNSANGLTNVNDYNSILHQTDITTPSTADAPLADTAADFFTVRELGYRSLAADYRSTTSTLTTTGHFDDYAPLTGSAALGDATVGLVAYDDFYGNVRPATKDRGAIQVST